MQLATVTAEALAGLPAIDAGMADWPSGCTSERERLIAASVLALLLLLAAWWPPVRRYFSAISTADARIVRGMHMGTLIFFLGDAWFTFWNLSDCLGGGTRDTGNPDWWPLIPVGVMVAAMWKSGVFDDEESEKGEPEDEE